MTEERTRIDFNAPTPLVERADALADVLGTSRTRILVDALRDELDELARESSVRREVREAFYDRQIAFETLERALGTEEARRVSLLRESLGREPPDPQLEGVPDDEAFYDGDLPEWTPDDPKRTPSEDEDADDGTGSSA